PQERVDRGAQLALVEPASPPLERRMAEIVRLQRCQQTGAVDIELHLRQPGPEQAAPVLGAKTGAHAALAGVPLEHDPLRKLERRSGAGRTARTEWLTARMEHARPQRQRAVRPLRGAALLAARGDSPRSQVREELLRRGRGRCFGVGAPDVYPGVVVGAADGGPPTGLDVHGCGRVELGSSRAVARLPYG